MSAVRIDPQAIASERRWTTGRALLVLWSGVLFAPLGWILHLSVSYGMATLVCPGSRWLLGAATVGSLALALTGGWIAWRTWREIGTGQETDGSVIGRSRFMAVSGLALTAMFVTAILVQSIPPLFLRFCE
jgi:hypothetical protein